MHEPIFPAFYNRAARALGVTRRTLYNWMRAAGLAIGTWPAKQRTWLTQTEVAVLAAAHKRLVQDIDGLRDPLQEITDLREQVSRLEVRLLTVEGQLQTLTSLLGNRLALGEKADEPGEKTSR